MPTVWNHKRSLNIIARKKSFQGEQNGAFLLFVMLVFKVLPEVQQLNYTILVVSWWSKSLCWNTERKYIIGRPIMPSLWLMTNLTQDEARRLKEVGFLLIEKLKCHPKNLFSDDASLLVINQWMKIIDQKFKTRKIFVVFQYSRSLFNNKTSGKLDMFFCKTFYHPPMFLLSDLEEYI